MDFSTLKNEKENHEFLSSYGEEKTILNEILKKKEN